MRAELATFFTNIIFTSKKKSKNNNKRNFKQLTKIIQTGEFGHTFFGNKQNESIISREQMTDLLPMIKSGF